MLRTAEATGMTGIIFLGDRCDPFDPVVVRASVGTFPTIVSPIQPTRIECIGAQARDHPCRIDAERRSIVD